MSILGQNLNLSDPGQGGGGGGVQPPVDIDVTEWGLTTGTIFSGIKSAWNTVNPNSSSNASVTRSISGTPTDARKLTVAVWAKGGDYDTQMNVLTNTINNFSIGFRNDLNSHFTQMYMGGCSGGVANDGRRSGYHMLDDEWSHYCWIWDSTEASSVNRIRFYKNGKRVVFVDTIGGGAPALNEVCPLWSDTPASTLMGCSATEAGLRGIGTVIMAGLHIVDGYVVEPENFAYYDYTQQYRYISVDYAGPYGTLGGRYRLGTGSNPDSSGNGQLGFSTQAFPNATESRTIDSIGWSFDTRGPGGIWQTGDARPNQIIGSSTQGYVMGRSNRDFTLADTQAEVENRIDCSFPIPSEGTAAWEYTVVCTANIGDSQGPNTNLFKVGYRAGNDDAKHILLGANGSLWVDGVETPGYSATTFDNQTGESVLAEYNQSTQSVRWLIDATQIASVSFSNLNSETVVPHIRVTNAKNDQVWEVNMRQTFNVNPTYTLGANSLSHKHTNLAGQDGAYSINGNLASMKIIQGSAGNESNRRASLYFAPDVLLQSTAYDNGEPYDKYAYGQLWNPSGAGWNKYLPIFANVLDAVSVNPMLRTDPLGWTVQGNGQVFDTGDASSGVVTKTAWQYQGLAMKFGPVTNPLSAQSDVTEMRSDAQQGWSMVKYTPNGLAAYGVPHGLNDEPDVVIIMPLGFQNDAADSQIIYWNRELHAFDPVVLKLGLFNQDNEEASSFPSGAHIWGTTPDYVQVGADENVNTNTKEFLMMCFSRKGLGVSSGAWVGSGEGYRRFIWTPKAMQWCLVTKNGGTATDQAAIAGWASYEKGMGQNIHFALGGARDVQTSQSNSNDIAFRAKSIQVGNKWDQSGYFYSYLALTNPFPLGAVGGAFTIFNPTTTIVS